MHLYLLRSHNIKMVRAFSHLIPCLLLGILAFINESDAEAVFVEFFVPGPCETVWSPGANVCAWLPTGIDSEGRKPAREIAYHIHGQDDGL